jgi:hypothetical protein
MVRQVKPLVAPTISMLENEGSAGWPRVCLLWLPFTLVYIMDVQVWFAIWLAIAGSLVGWSQNIGEVRSFTMVRERFLEIHRAFNKLLPSEVQVNLPPNLS